MNKPVIAVVDSGLFIIFSEEEGPEFDENGVAQRPQQQGQGYIGPNVFLEVSITLSTLYTSLRGSRLRRRVRLLHFMTV